MSAAEERDRAVKEKEAVELALEVTSSWNTYKNTYEADECRRGARPSRQREGGG